MSVYIISLLSASLATALISALAPEGSVAKHIRLLSALFLISVLAVPITKLTKTLTELSNGELSFSGLEETVEPDLQEQMQAALDDASKQYFLESLAQMISQEFSIETGDLRCVASWKVENGTAKPSKITVLLSGSAIWKDPAKIQAYVSDLLACECVIAIE